MHIRLKVDAEVQHGLRSQAALNECQEDEEAEGNVWLYNHIKRWVHIKIHVISTCAL